MKSKKNLIRAIGNDCKQFRLSVGITQYDLADKFGVDQSNISRYENGLLNSIELLMMYINLGYQLKKEGDYIGEK